MNFGGFLMAVSRDRPESFPGDYDGSVNCRFAHDAALAQLEKAGLVFVTRNPAR